ncbi:MAG: hypothetical protein PHV34_00045 [Verrucomicrobiae bacterium]|nr:hypothetical protein [Verrucomicrobiae bacterium]
MKTALQRMLAFSMLLFCLADPQTIRAETGVEIVPLPVSLDMVDRHFSWDECSLVTGARIAQLPVKDQPALEPMEVEQIIDSDFCSGPTLPARGEFLFLINLNKISRIRSIAIAGVLQDMIISVRATDQFISPAEKGWRAVLEERPLFSPSVTLQIQPRSILQIMVSIRTNSAQPEFAPAIYDLSVFGEHDVREFELLSGKTSQEMRAAGPGMAAAGNLRDSTSIFNLAGMHAHARVAYISASVKPDHAFALNDGNPSTYCPFDTRKTESVAVLDLNQIRNLRRISIVHSQRPGEIRCYAPKELPWEYRPQTKLAWLLASSSSDVPFLAQLGLNPAKSDRPENLQIAPSVFDSMPQIGSARTDLYKFSRVNAPQNIQGRYLVVRYTNPQVDSTGDLRIYDVNAFGDYRPAEFTLAPRELPPIQADALITAPNPQTTSGATTDATTGDANSVDLTKLGVFSAPMPASPSTP